MTNEGRREIQWVINEIRYPGWRKQFKQKWDRIFGNSGKGHRRGPAGPSAPDGSVCSMGIESDGDRANDEMVKIVGYVPRTFFGWFDRQIATNEHDREMLRRCRFKETGR